MTKKEAFFPMVGQYALSRKKKTKKIVIVGHEAINDLLSSIMDNVLW